MSPFNRMFGGRSPAPVHVRYQDGEPVEFQRRPLRRGSRFLVTQIGTSEGPVTLALPIDWRLFGFMVALSVLTAVGFGLVPALRARRPF